MNALLINPIDETITEVTFSGDYKQIQKAIDANCFGVVSIPNDDDIYIDDEGLLKGNNYFFMHKDVPTPLCGKGLVLGANHDTGDSTSVHVTLKELKHSITFLGQQGINHSRLGFTIKEMA